jgi:hypothetical protein
VEDAVRVCAKIVPVFEKEGIPIIRLGLNPSDDLSSGDAAGGAYHPALGELVRSRILLERAVPLLDGVEPGSDVLIGIRRRLVSQMAGQHGCNKEALRRRFALHSIRILGTDSKNDEIDILSVAKPGIL